MTLLKITLPQAPAPEPAQPDLGPDSYVEYAARLLTEGSRWRPMLMALDAERRMAVMRAGHANYQTQLAERLGSSGFNIAAHLSGIAPGWRETALTPTNNQRRAWVQESLDFFTPLLELQPPLTVAQLQAIADASARYNRHIEQTYTAILPHMKQLDTTPQNRHAAQRNLLLRELEAARDQTMDAYNNALFDAGLIDDGAGIRRLRPQDMRNPYPPEYPISAATEADASAILTPPPLPKVRRKGEVAWQNQL